jgi:hypothetical protein
LKESCRQPREAFDGPAVNPPAMPRGFEPVQAEAKWPVSLR